MLAADLYKLEVRSRREAWQRVGARGTESRGLEPPWGGCNEKSVLRSVGRGDLSLEYEANEG